MRKKKEDCGSLFEGWRQLISKLGCSHRNEFIEGLKLDLRPDISHHQESKMTPEKHKERLITLLLIGSSNLLE